MNIILLSGGSGKRLWPLSNDIRSKQFIKLFKDSEGNYESMVQRVFRQISTVDKGVNITIATSSSQASAIMSQLGEKVSICTEPCRRDTFPAIALAATYLVDELNVSRDECVVVCPVDPYVNIDYFECIKKMSDEAGKTNLTLMGIEPTYPSEKYGYIIPTSSDPISFVKEFKEKPDEEMAKKYIQEGALWNGGVFAFKLSYLLDIACTVLGTDSYDELLQNYSKLQKISFDYAVAEKEKNITVIRFKGDWKDLGTWNTLSEAMMESTTGNAVVDSCDNTHVINELEIPLVALGIKNAIIAATPDGILVSDKEYSPRLKDYVENARPMYERRGWGEYKVLNYRTHQDKQNSLVKELIISPGEHISYQRHFHRMEIWTFIEGTGELIIDDKARKVSRGDTVIIQQGVKHAIKGITELHIIEVQIGDELTEEDIERLEWKWE